MAVDVHDHTHEEEEPEPFKIPGFGLVKGLLVTLKHLLSRSITQQYPHEKPDLPPRTRGVISLKAENCTVCWKCSRECPDWCIYIESHKETHEPASGGRARSAKVLDRFAIDYALCMYCGICVEVCPFDALFWSPEFEYAEYSIIDMLHEKERLDEWNYTVLPPPELEVGAEPSPSVSETSEESGSAGGAGAADSRAFGPPASGTALPAAGGPGALPPTAPADTSASAGGGPGGAEGSVSAGGSVGGAHGEAPGGTAANATAAEPKAPQAEPPAPPSAQAQPAAPAAREHVELDQETYDRVLAEEIAKGTSARVAEGRAKSAAIKAARAKGAS